MNNIYPLDSHSLWHSIKEIEWYMNLSLRYSSHLVGSTVFTNKCFINSELSVNCNNTANDKTLHFWKMEEGPYIAP